MLQILSKDETRGKYPGSRVRPSYVRKTINSYMVVLAQFGWDIFMIISYPHMFGVHDNMSLY